MIRSSIKECMHLAGMTCWTYWYVVFDVSVKALRPSWSKSFSFKIWDLNFWFPNASVGPRNMFRLTGSTASSIQSTKSSDPDRKRRQRSSPRPLRRRSSRPPNRLLLRTIREPHWLQRARSDRAELSIPAASTRRLLSRQEHQPGEFCC